MGDESRQKFSQGLFPRGIGQLLDDNFSFYREKFGFLIASGLCFLVPYHVLSAYINTHYSLVDLETKIQELQSGAAGVDPQTASLSQFWSPALTWSLALTIIYSLLVTPLLYGMIVHMLTNHHIAGKDVNLSDASVHAFKRLVSSVLTTILLGLLYFVIVFGMILIASAVSAFARQAAMLVSIVTLIVVLCVVIWFAARFSLVPSVVIEEHKMTSRALARSWQLTKGNFWRVVIYFVLLFVLIGILRFAVLFAAAALIKNSVLVAVISTIVDVLIVPFFMLGTANIYADLRVRSDG